MLGSGGLNDSKRLATLRLSASAENQQHKAPGKDAGGFVFRPSPPAVRRRPWLACRDDVRAASMRPVATLGTIARTSRALRADVAPSDGSSVAWVISNFLSSLEDQDSTKLQRRAGQGALSRSPTIGLACG
jgi:hypothetical protein